eukprot:tig00020918_g15893.t1
MDEDAAIRSRLVGSTPALKQALRQALKLSASIETTSAAECAALHQTLLRLLALFEFNAAKAQIAADSAAREEEEHHFLIQDIEALKAEAKSSIGDLNGQVRVEKTLRRFKEEYENVARKVNELPARQRTAKEIEVLEADLQSLVGEREQLDSKLDLRSKQFEAFLHSIFELQELELERLD